ncbi:hypothetical protein [Methylibium petroleiphilum]|uniref:Ankyrin repeat domain-containing protein n=1 Tax=Methylibium petroleiphilum (strain ATCC BAA-1232 / LMG 22953 / PM1) TaxID=420662 RepID=A2SPC0_METPP|nr:hypothetical protein [Methylibium petroleiphilum]ABM97409.1 hypothetical protein Mpe_B0645 [Methylibium petroleiphilum PM1]
MQPIIPAVLSGAARENARQDLDNAIIKALTDIAPESLVAEAARVDPSILLERNRFSGLGFNAFNYLELARHKEWTDTLEVALEAGIHPDNRDAFSGRPLLARRGIGLNSLPGPKLLGLALRYGADASQCADGDGYRSLARTYAAELQPLTTSNLATVKSHLACLRLLLQAEPGPLDPVDRDMSGSFIGHGLLVTLGTARILTTTLSLAQPLAKEGYDLLRLAAARGADINWRAGAQDIPVVWTLVNAGFAKSAALLLELGADPEMPADADASNLGFEVGTSLVELARLRSGGEGAAAISETLMRRRIQAEQRVQVAPPAPAKQPRRRWLLGAF